MQFSSVFYGVILSLFFSIFTADSTFAVEEKPKIDICLYWYSKVSEHQISLSRSKESFENALKSNGCFKSKFQDLQLLMKSNFTQEDLREATKILQKGLTSRRESISVNYLQAIQFLSTVLPFETFDSGIRQFAKEIGAYELPKVCMIEETSDCHAVFYNLALNYYAQTMSRFVWPFILEQSSCKPITKAELLALLAWNFGVHSVHQNKSIL